MKKFILIVTGIFVLTVPWRISAEITLNGDARVRPRLDQKFSGGKKTYHDFYYLYWARLWLNAELTEGWYFKALLAADGPANFIGKFGMPTYDGIESWGGSKAAHSGYRGALRFGELHFGRQCDKFGYSLGILPFNALKNTELDLHFYPISTSDIPYLILNMNSAAGFRGYYQLGPGKLNATLSVDNNESEILRVAASSPDTTYQWVHDENDGHWETITTPAQPEEIIRSRDTYSFFLNYNYQFNEIFLQPTFIKTFADKKEAAPLTFGLNASFPPVAKFKFSCGAFYTIQNIVQTERYNGKMIHAKLSRTLGPGKMVCWGDYKNVNFKQDAEPYHTTYLWFMYQYTVYQSDVGKLVLAPTFRRIIQTHDQSEYIRNKIELTIHMSFK